MTQIAYDESILNIVYINSLLTEENECIDHGHHQFNQTHKGTTSHHWNNTLSEVKGEDFLHHNELYRYKSANDIKCEEYQVYRPNILPNAEMQTIDSSTSINVNSVNESNELLIEISRIEHETPSLKAKRKLSKSSNNNKSTNSKKSTSLQLKIDVPKHDRVLQNSAPYLNLRFNRRNMTPVIKKKSNSRRINTLTKKNKYVHHFRDKKGKFISLKKLLAKKNANVKIPNKSGSGQSFKTVNLPKTCDDSNLHSKVKTTTKNKSRKNCSMNRIMINKTNKLPLNKYKVQKSNNESKVKSCSGKLSSKKSGSNKTNVTSKINNSVKRDNLTKQITSINSTKLEKRNYFAEGMNLRSKKLVGTNEPIANTHNSQQLSNVPSDSEDRLAFNKSSFSSPTNCKEHQINVNESNTEWPEYCIQLINAELDLSERVDSDFDVINDSNKVSQEVSNKYEINDTANNMSVCDTKSEEPSSLSQQCAPCLTFDCSNVFPRSNSSTNTTTDTSFVENDHHSTNEMGDLSKINKELNELFLNHDFAFSSIPVVEVTPNKSMKHDDEKNDVCYAEQKSNTGEENVIVTPSTDKKCDRPNIRNSSKLRKNTTINKKRNISKKNIQNSKTNKIKSQGKKRTNCLDKGLDKCIKRKISQIMKEFNNVITKMQEKPTGSTTKTKVRSQKINELKNEKLKKETVPRKCDNATLNLRKNKRITKKVNRSNTKSQNGKLIRDVNKTQIIKNDKKIPIDKFGKSNEIKTLQLEDDNYLDTINKEIDNALNVNLDATVELKDGETLEDLQSGCNMKFENGVVKWTDNSTEAQSHNNIYMLCMAELKSDDVDIDNDNVGNEIIAEETNTFQTVNIEENIDFDDINKEYDNIMQAHVDIKIDGSIITYIPDYIAPTEKNCISKNSSDFAEEITVNPVIQQMETNKRALQNTSKVYDSEIKSFQNVDNDKLNIDVCNLNTEQSQMTQPSKNRENNSTEAQSDSDIHVSSTVVLKSGDVKIDNDNVRNDSQEK